MKNRKNLIITCSLLAVALILTIFLGIYFKSFSLYQAKFYKGTVTENHTLVEFSKNLGSTVGGTTDIYMIYDKNNFAQEDFDSKGNLKPEVASTCPSLLVLGGTHPNEPSGQLAATILLENAVVGGKSILFVINETNKSAFTHSHPQEASPQYYTLKTASGSVRTFKFGSRATNTNEQWPCPDVYTGLAGQKLSSTDSRNLNRSYPGKEDGTYSEKVAYGITNLIRTYDIKMTIDLHEASPEYKTINAIIYHENAAYLVSTANMWYIASANFDQPLSIEPSDPTLHGLTHRELGDYTNTFCVICETSNASQGKIRGAFTTELILDGTVDKFYAKALEVSNNLPASADKIIYGEPTTIDVRVGRHLECIIDLVLGYNNSIDDFDLNRVYIDGEIVKKADNPEAIAARQAFLYSCGEMDITVDLGSQNGGTYIDGGNYYSTLVQNGVGYFLADENKCE